jgi:glycosyltransferase involved in cell wall biosynthesis
LEDDDHLIRIVLSRPGVTYARNAILARATGDIVVFLDDDVVLPNDFFDVYHAAFVQTGAQVIQGQVVQLYGLTDFSLSAEALRPCGTPQYGSESGTMTDLGFIIGANHAVRRERALAIGGYDGHMSCGASKNEEADFVVRAAQAPGDVYYAAECWLIHYSAPSGGQRAPLRPIRDEWKKSYTDLLWCFRHGRLLGNPGKLFWKAIRRGPLRKDNIRRFWRQPWAWISFFFAAIRALRHTHEILGIAPSGVPRQFRYCFPPL